MSPVLCLTFLEIGSWWIEQWWVWWKWILKFRGERCWWGRDRRDRFGGWFGGSRIEGFGRTRSKRIFCLSQQQLYRWKWARKPTVWLVSISTGPRSKYRSMSGGFMDRLWTCTVSSIPLSETVTCSVSPSTRVLLVSKEWYDDYCQIGDRSLGEWRKVWSWGSSSLWEYFYAPLLTVVDISIADEDDEDLIQDNEEISTHYSILCDD